jgi:putative ABC transport system substrate-binding protein
MRLLALICLFLFAMPAQSQAAGEKTFHLGLLAPSPASLEFTRVTTLPELAKLGFQDGRNLALDARASEDPAGMERAARELVAANPDTVIAIGMDAAQAIHAATKTVPIVLFGGDPVRAGLAESLVHPGGHVTGVVIFGTQLDGKRLALLHDAVPNARRIAALLHSGPDRLETESEVRDVAVRLGLEIISVSVDDRRGYAGGFAVMHDAHAEALIITAHPQLYADADQLLALARENGLPSICEWAEMAQSGCLLAYGPDRAALRQRLAHYVARIFRGTPPGEQPIEQPTVFKLAINLATARALNLTLPAGILALADEVIE